MLNVQIVLFDGFDLMDALAPYEVFSAVSLYLDNAIALELVTAEGPRFVPSGMGGLRIEASGRLSPERGGIVLVPGAAGGVEGDGYDSVPAILGRAMTTDLTGLMGQALARPDVTVATVCGGSLLLAMGGLLEGRHAVTHRLGMGIFGATGAIPVPARVVDDGDLVSGGGVTSGLDVALYLVERELGPRIAHEIERLFEYERRGTPWRQQGLAPIVRPLSADEAQTEEPDFAESTIAGPLSTSESMSVYDGEWETTIATPVGKLAVQLSIATRDGRIQGTATQGGETVELLNPVVAKGNLQWSMRVAKPMRLHLKFEVAVDGDRMVGAAKAGILPASKLTGRRVAGPNAATVQA
ncbi:DJ-1/PfpI family protein [Cohnella sp. GbtcB17]|uniref:DJ-1/PfpI family protein n=1 Tax=Cohnella sp. GbtcB17 TaxID=2824762 RepID=UPI001C30E520|nr:DJ-1/PfpI family protein [Cohnella sp. GbtcB17]